MIDLKLLQVGDIVIVNAREGSFLSKAIRLFSGADWTHACFITGDIQDEPILYEAEIQMENNPAKEYICSANYDYLVWRLNVPQSTLDQCAKEVMEEGIHANYGVETLPWFVWRWLQLQVNPSAKVIGQQNWFPNRICSEETFYFLIKVANSVPQLLELIKPYNRYTTAPGDLARLFYKSIQDGKNIIGLIDSRVDFKNYPHE